VNCRSTGFACNPLFRTATAKPVLPDGSALPDDTCGVTWSDGSAVGLLEYKPAIAVDNKVYIGEDNGVSCGSKAVEMVTGAFRTRVVYCFNVTNTGDTHLNSVKLTNAELNFTDNSIGLLAPKQSVLVAFLSNITANLTNIVVVTGNPSLSDGADISGAQDVTASDPSQVALNKTDGDVKETVKEPYSPPNTTQECLQDKWTKAGENGTLVCSPKQVAWEGLTATKTLQCKPGEKINVTVDGTMMIDGARNDLGWYVAADGGDALMGRCIVNGFQSMYNYTVTKGAGKIVWLTGAGGDNDPCGDVAAAEKVFLKTRALVNAEVTCADENEDGVLDVSICFTWRADSFNTGVCSISNNIPGCTSSCYCSRYDIKKVVVEKPVPACA
jgi:hypothetical protein